MGGSPDFPEPSAEERALQAEQTQLLRQQRDLLSRQIRDYSTRDPKPWSDCSAAAPSQDFVFSLRVRHYNQQSKRR